MLFVNTDRGIEWCLGVGQSSFTGGFFWKGVLGIFGRGCRYEGRWRILPLYLKIRRLLILWGRWNVLERMFLKEWSFAIWASGVLFWKPSRFRFRLFTRIAQNKHLDSSDSSCYIPILYILQSFQATSVFKSLHPNQNLRNTHSAPFHTTKTFHTPETRWMT